MPTYAILDRDSGYLFGVMEADDPASACRKLDLLVSGVRRTYEQHGPHSETERKFGLDAAYFVHEVPYGWQAEDGQDQTTIDTAIGYPRVAVVTCRLIDED